MISSVATGVGDDVADERARSKVSVCCSVLLVSSPLEVEAATEASCFFSPAGEDAPPSSVAWEELPAGTLTFEPVLLKNSTFPSSTVRRTPSNSKEVPLTAAVATGLLI